MSTIPSPAEVLDQLLRYAALGMAVTPGYEIGPAGRCTCPQGGACSSPGKHPRTTHGLLDASTDPVRIRTLVRRYPTANWAVRTGATSGVDVLDVDPRHGGQETLARLARDYGPFPATVAATTGSDGEHRFYLHHDGLRNSVARLGPGVDVRADGGHVIVAPSNHASGGRYRWQPDRAPGETPVAAWPPALAAALLPPAMPPPSLAPRPPGIEARIPASLIRWADRGAPLGQQTHRAFWLACRLRQHGADEHEGAAIMGRFAAACSPTADRRKIATIWRDSAKYQGYQPTLRLPEPRRPRTAHLPEPIRPTSGVTR